MPAESLKQDLGERMEGRLPEIYLVLALVVTVLLCWMTPPFFAPDEANHADREVSLLHGHLIEKTTPDGAGNDIDDGLVEVSDAMDNVRMEWEKHAGFFLDRTHGSITDEQQLAHVNGRWTGWTIFEDYENTAVYPPPLYLPAMAGWKTGEAANWTIFASLRFARLLCALCAVALGWLALRYCVGSRWLLFAGLMLPSVLDVNATCCQDAVVPGLSALAVAMLSRALAGKRYFSRMELVVAAVAVGLLGLARPPYAAMALMLFAPVAELRSNWRRWVAPGVAMAVTAAVTVFWWRAVSGLQVATNDVGNPDLQHVFLKAHPFAAALAVMRGTAYAAYDFLHRGVYVVGLNDLLPHHGAAAVLSLCLLAIVFAASGPMVVSWRGRIMLAMSVLGPLLGVSLAEYIIWTPPGFFTVYGVMPRYWFAALPLGFLLLQSLIPRRDRWLAVIPRRTVMVAGVVMMLMACTLPWMVAHAFYHEGVLHVLRLNLR